MAYNCEHIYNCAECNARINEWETRTADVQHEKILAALDSYQQQVRLTGAPLFKDWTHDSVCKLIEDIKHTVRNL